MTYRPGRTTALLLLLFLPVSAFGADDTRMIYMSLSLRPENQSRDLAQVQAVIDNGTRAGVTAVLLVVPSHHEAPGALSHWIVTWALQEFRCRDIDVIWGRNLWMMWPKPGDAGDITTMESVRYYRDAIRAVRTEAESIGAASMLEGEPYGDCAVKRLYKKRDLPLLEMWMIRLAITEATVSEGLVDYIYPVDSGSPQYPWAVRHLGRVGLNAKTYRWREVPARVPQAPQAFPHWELQSWGVWVTNNPGKYGYTPSVLIAAEALKIKHPSVWWYIGHDEREFGPTLKQLAEGE